MISKINITQSLLLRNLNKGKNSIYFSKHHQKVMHQIRWTMNMRHLGHRKFRKSFFWRRLLFKLAEWVKKIAITSVGGHHPVHWGLNRKEGQRKGSCTLCLSCDIPLLLSDTDTSESRAFELRLNYTSGSHDPLDNFMASPNCMSQFWQ